jgi:hypothetical protein
MSPARGRVIRALAISGMIVVSAWGLSACSKDNNQASDGSFNQTIRGEGGSESSVSFGKDAKLPANFPPGVPLPTARPLRSVVSEKNPPNASYTMTYLIGDNDGLPLGNQYRDHLAKAGFKIKHYSSVGGSDGGITQFDAIGKKWDVAVVSGRTGPRDRSTLSVQVHTHGQITSGISGIGDTTPKVTAPAGSGVEIPDPNASTTSTTLGF